MSVFLQQRPQHITKLIYCSRTVPELEKVYRLFVLYCSLLLFLEVG